MPSQSFSRSSRISQANRRDPSRPHFYGARALEDTNVTAVDVEVHADQLTRSAFGVAGAGELVDVYVAGGDPDEVAARLAKDLVPGSYVRVHAKE